MRTTKVRISQAKVGGRRFWCVTFRKVGTGRHRHFFKDRGEASTFSELKKVPPPEEASRLLASSPDSLLPYLAIGFFAGIRRAELERLNWREVKLDQGFVEVSAKNSKTARRRLARSEPNLDAWIRPTPRKVAHFCQ